MKRYQLTPSPTGSTLEVQIEEIDTPQPAADQVLIKIKACSLNYRDLLMKSGSSASSGDSPIIPLSDGAGEIVEIGSEVSDWKAGDRVMPTFFENWIDGDFNMRYHKAALGGSIDGVLSEYIAIPATGIVKIPDYLSFEEASSLPCAALTAWQSLFERGHAFDSNQTVLCLGTGGVSIFALQMAKAVGGKVIITSSSEDKLGRARDLGADETINYRENPDWDKAIFDLTQKTGVDHIIEVGGPGTLEKSMNSIKAGGIISMIGVLTGFDPTPASLFPLVARAVNLHGIYVGSQAMFDRMNQFLAEHEIRPVIDQTFSFEEANAAYSHLESGKHLGKVVIRV